jgi:hypothetical protein
MLSAGSGGLSTKEAINQNTVAEAAAGTVIGAAAQLTTGSQVYFVNSPLTR